MAKLNIKKPTGVFTLIAIVFFIPSVSHAYLDPGTGSIILQGLIAAIAGAMLTIRLYWFKIKSIISNLFSNDKNDG